MHEPDAAHTRPEGTTDATVAAVGKVSEACEYLVRARGHLYSFHQLMGRVDLLLQDAADMLADAGHHAEATELRTRVVGLDAIPGHWTFQIVEKFDATYHDTVMAAEAAVREALLEGRRHVQEAETKAAEQR